MKTKVTFLWILLTLLVVAPAFAGGWLIYHDGPYAGTVVDAETGEPIEGVAVVVIWNLERFGGAGGPIAKFFEAKETLTNEKGEFIISSITGFHWWPLAKLDKPGFVFFKPSYAGYPSGRNRWYFEKHDSNLANLIKLKTKEERIKSFFTVNTCGTEVKDRAILESCIPIRKIKNAVDLINQEAVELGLMN